MQRPRPSIEIVTSARPSTPVMSTRVNWLAAWTKKHGKDDEKNPDWKQNYYQLLSKMGKH